MKKGLQPDQNRVGGGKMLFASTQVKPVYNHEKIESII